MALDSLNWCSEVLLNHSKLVLPKNLIHLPLLLRPCPAPRLCRKQNKLLNHKPSQLLSLLPTSALPARHLPLRLSLGPASPHCWAYTGDCCRCWSCSCPTLRVAGHAPARGFVSVTLPASLDSSSLPSTTQGANSTPPLPALLPRGPFGKRGAVTAGGCPGASVQPWLKEQVSPCFSTCVLREE